jgi:hypothetical protein
MSREVERLGDDNPPDFVGWGFGLRRDCVLEA